MEQFLEVRRNHCWREARLSLFLRTEQQTLEITVWGTALNFYVMMPLDRREELASLLRAPEISVELRVRPWPLRHELPLPGLLL